jgi:hypothetical protein
MDQTQIVAVLGNTFAVVKLDLKSGSELSSATTITPVTNRVFTYQGLATDSTGNVLLSYTVGTTSYIEKYKSDFSLSLWCTTLETSKGQSIHVRKSDDMAVVV